MKIFILIVLVFMFNNFNYGQDRDTEMTTVELKKEMKNNPDLIILDVRTLPELNGPLGHIKGIDHIPVQELDSRINELEKYKNKDIAVICRTGNRSGTATKFLLGNGFNAKNVLGGMVDYNK